MSDIKLPSGLRWGDCTESVETEGAWDAVVWYGKDGFGSIGTDRNPIRAYEKAIAEAVKARSKS